MIWWGFCTASNTQASTEKPSHHYKKWETLTQPSSFSRTTNNNNSNDNKRIYNPQSVRQNEKDRREDIFYYIFLGKICKKRNPNYITTDECVSVCVFVCWWWVDGRIYWRREKFRDALSTDWGWGERAPAWLIAVNVHFHVSFIRMANVLLLYFTV